MFIDAREVARDSTIETGICVIGAGAAGITLALALRGAGFPVAVLESGGFDYDDATQDLYVGELAGVPNYPTDKSRLRFFGGTTNHWAGTSRPLDDIDFEPREAVPLSGWPLRRADLLGWYEQAQRLCQLGPFRYDIDFWAGKAGLKTVAFDPARLQTAVFQISPPTRFGQVYRDDLRLAENVTVYLNANAVDLRANATASAVEEIKVATLATPGGGSGGGSGFVMRAKYFVLAAGGLENARLLLLSNTAQPAGLGNGNDLVGRYFMDHPYLPWSAIARYGTPDPPLPYTPAPPDSTAFATLAPTERDGIAGFQVLLGELRHLVDGVDSLKTVATALSHFSVPAHLWDHLGNILRDRDEVAGAIWRTITHGKTSPFTTPATGPATGPVLGASMDILLEQTPNPDSRVSLIAERDALGLNRIKLDWRFTEIERRTYARAQQLVALEFGRLDIGRVAPKPLPEHGWPDDILGANHHIGTTRMSDDAKTGVVDRDCLMHGVGNLYIAGSSVFPTSGYTNPTLTIVALALRLGDALRRKMA